LHGVDDVEMRWAPGIGVDDADGIRDVVADPGLEAVGSDRDADGVDANGDSFDRAVRVGVKDINSIGWGVGDEEAVVVEDDRLEVRAEKGGVAHFGGGRRRLVTEGVLSIAGGKKPDPQNGKSDEDESGKKAFHGMIVVYLLRGN
jgi:hypothetical protein